MATAVSSTVENTTGFSSATDFIPFAPSSPPPSPSEYPWRRLAQDPSTGGERDGNKDRKDGHDRTENRRVGNEEYRNGRDVDMYASKRRHDQDPGQNYGYKKPRLDIPARKAPWVKDIDWDRCRNVAEMLNDEVEAFVRYISPTDVEHEVRSLVVEMVSKAVTQAYPDAEVHPFGSFETRLYLPHGDIDLVVLSNSMAYSDRVSVLRSLATTLKRAQITNKVTIIAKAKVPIIKFVTNYGKFNVDISINQGNGVQAGKIVKGFLDNLHGRGQGWALRCLIMVTKLFLSQRGLNEVFSGGLGSYSIVCLAVNFLQMHPKLRGGEIDAEKNMGVLLMEFFELYGLYFNYDEVGISLRDGGTYFNKQQRGWVENATYRLSIEDPADPTNDISRGSFGIAKVRTTLAGAYGILSATTYLRAGILEARREGRFFKLGHRYHPEELSILSTVVGVTQEMIDHRQYVRDILSDKKASQSARSIPSSKHDTTKRAENGKTHKKSKQAPAKAAASVSHLWNDEAVEIEYREKRRATKLRRDEEEEGRYAIEQRPQKRARKHDWDARAEFTADEGSDLDLGSSHSSVRAVSDREGGDHRAVGIATSRSGAKRIKRTSTPANIEGRRSYWRSKGAGGGDGHDEYLL